MPLAAESCPSYRIEMAFNGDGPCFSSDRDDTPQHDTAPIKSCHSITATISRVFSKLSPYFDHNIHVCSLFHFDLSSFKELYISSEIVLGLTPKNAATCSGKQQLQPALQHGSYPEWKNVAY